MSEVRDPVQAARDVVSGERALAGVVEIARHHRVQASPGYDAACRWLVGELEPLGLELELEHVPGDGRTRFHGALMPEGWECSRATAVLHDGARRDTLCDYAALELSLVLRSAPAHGRFPIVRVDGGAEASDYDGVDVRGAVVLTRGAPHRVHRRAVIERGAAGLLCDGRRLLPGVRDAGDERDAVNYTSFWWGEAEPRGWGFVVSPATGDRLRARLAAGGRLELEVAIESRSFPTRIPLLSARLPGGGADEVMVLAHLCHPRPSANDNASGAAALLETARALAALEAGGRLAGAARSIRLLWVPEFTGSYAWLALDPRRIPRIAGALNLDMVGEDQAQCGSTLLLEHPPCFMGSWAEEWVRAERHASQDWVEGFSGPGHYSLARLGEVPFSGGSDHAVFADPAFGVPCPMLVQWPDRFYHSSHDTPDRTDPRSLALAARTATAFALGVACADGAALESRLAAAGRAARRRLLAAADGPEAERRLAAERLRGHAVLASHARLGVAEERIVAARAAFEEFARREGLRAEPAPPGPGPGPAVPVRSVRAPLDYQRHRLPGWDGLADAARDAWHALDGAAPRHAPLLDVAWYAADGRRTLEEITRLAWLETGHHRPELVARLFEQAAGLGLCRLERGRGA